MSRPDACTHSISRITVSRTRGDLEFCYWPSAEIHPGAMPSRCRLKFAVPLAA
ncbi:MAG: hypothetical protein RQ826_12310 [Xanthomonadales bacterium]|nr:hypothetical protein [Xanthomonadales bacterium]